MIFFFQFSISFFGQTLKLRGLQFGPVGALPRLLTERHFYIRHFRKISFIVFKASLTFTGKGGGSTTEQQEPNVIQLFVAIIS
jgi:hypothetical protein